MQIHLAEPCHLAYCSNVFKGETWHDIFSNIKKFMPPVKKKIAPHQAFGIGLHLSYQAALDLLEPNTLLAFKQWLDQHHIYIFTINACTYGDFHSDIVKEAVFSPDWTQPQRVEYTALTLKLLAQLLPEQLASGSISTIPLAYKPLIPDADRTDVLEQCALNLAQLVATMDAIQNETQKILHVNLEPEPDCLLETFRDFLNFYQACLLPIASEYLIEQLNCTLEQAAQKIYRHIRLCYDICHFSIAYEDHKAVFESLHKTPIQIGKIQLSAALKVLIPKDQAARLKLKKNLAPFCEKTYLHQIVERKPDNSLKRFSDLQQGLETLDNTDACQWRIHYHVPLFQKQFPLFESTQDCVQNVLTLLQNQPICPHIEIETYTWSVLPIEYQGDLSHSIVREYEWVLETIGQNCVV